MIQLQVGNVPNNALALTNRVYVSPGIYQRVSSEAAPVEGSNGKAVLATVDGTPYAMSPHPSIGDDVIGMNGIQRRVQRLAVAQAVLIEPFVPPSNVNFALGSIELAVNLLSKKATGRPKEIDTDRLAEEVLLSYEGQVFRPGQIVAMKFNGTTLEVAVAKVELMELGNDNSNSGMPSQLSDMGILLGQTEIFFKKAHGSRLVDLQGGRLVGSSSGGVSSMFLRDFDFEKLGIGGLNAEFNEIFRRAFASRIFPTHITKSMGINHVRGMLLYGPPGCGKTLIARQIGKVLNAREPKIVNGPEILNKYVGGSEEKIRELFAEVSGFVSNGFNDLSISLKTITNFHTTIMPKKAEEEQKEAGDASMLHIIILDEMDAICKQRGSVRDGTGVSDSVVNQLLSKIDGVDSLNNILLIGMTNRKDMIDDALLRPGRLEVHVEIGLPGKFNIKL